MRQNKASILNMRSSDNKFIRYVRSIPSGSVVKNPPAMKEREETQVNPWVRKISWRVQWQPTPVFLLGKSHRQRSLVGYSVWGCKELWMSVSKHVLVYYTYYSWFTVVQVMSFPGGSDEFFKFICNAGDLVRSLDWKNPLEKWMATYSSVLAWKIQWTEELGTLLSMGSQGVGYDWVTKHSTYNSTSEVLSKFWVWVLKILAPAWKKEQLAENCERKSNISLLL